MIINALTIAQRSIVNMYCFIILKLRKYWGKVLCVFLSDLKLSIWNNKIDVVQYYGKLAALEVFFFNIDFSLLIFTPSKKGVWIIIFSLL